MRAYTDIFSIYGNDDESGYWIGLYATLQPCDLCNDQYCDACRFSWVWLDGASMTHTIINSWRSDKPSGDWKCARISRKGQLADKDCSTLYRFICERGKYSGVPHSCSAFSKNFAFVFLSFSSAYYFFL